VKLESSCRERDCSIVYCIRKYLYPFELGQRSVEAELRVCENLEQRFSFLPLESAEKALLRRCRGGGSGVVGRRGIEAGWEESIVFVELRTRSR